MELGAWRLGIALFGQHHGVILVDSSAVDQPQLVGFPLTFPCCKRVSVSLQADPLPHNDGDNRFSDYCKVQVPTRGGGEEVQGVGAGPAGSSGSEPVPDVPAIQRPALDVAAQHHLATRVLVSGPAVAGDVELPGRRPVDDLASQVQPFKVGDEPRDGIPAAWVASDCEGVVLGGGKG